MSNSGKLDPKHTELFKWAKSQGCKINKIAPAQLEYGVGVIATEDIKPGDVLAHVPTRLLLNLLTLPSLPDTSPITHPNTVHGTLAAHVANSIGGDGKDVVTDIWKTWVDVLPSWESFENGLPMFWNDEKLDLLPQGTKAYAMKQRRQLKDDFERSRKLDLKYTEDQYKWGWAVVNTRTIYYRPKKWAKIPTADCLCMCPVIDYINHEFEKEEDKETVFVQFSIEGISATAKQAYKKGEQVFVTYGSHSNDALLCEYGFTLDDNPWDSVILDSYVDSLLTPEHKKIMEEYSSSIPSGGCIISPSEPSFRLSIALHLSLIPPSELLPSSSTTTTTKRTSKNDPPAFENWKNMLTGEDEDVKGGVSAAQLQQHTIDICRKVLQDAEGKMKDLDKKKKQNEEEYDAVKQRWEQVRRLLKRYIESEE